MMSHVLAALSVMEGFATFTFVITRDQETRRGGPDKAAQALIREMTAAANSIGSRYRAELSFVGHFERTSPGKGKRLHVHGLVFMKGRINAPAIDVFRLWSAETHRRFGIDPALTKTAFQVKEVDWGAFNDGFFGALGWAAYATRDDKFGAHVGMNRRRLFASRRLHEGTPKAYSGWRASTPSFLEALRLYTRRIQGCRGARF